MPKLERRVRLKTDEDNLPECTGEEKCQHQQAALLYGAEEAGAPCNHLDI
jgi:hypothetical protein